MKNKKKKSNVQRNEVFSKLTLFYILKPHFVLSLLSFSFSFLFTFLTFSFCFLQIKRGVIHKGLSLSYIVYFSFIKK